MKLFAKKIVGIDFHDYSAQVVELNCEGEKLSLESYGRVILPSNVMKNGEIIKEDLLANALKELLAKANPSPIISKNVAVVFPSNKILTHVFSFPAALDAEEIGKALPYEAETIIPFSLNDVYFDFMVLHKEKESEKHATQQILFACIEKTTADKYAEVLEKIDLIPSHFGIHAETLQYTVPFSELDGNTNLLIDLGTLSSNFLLMKGKSIKSFYSGNDNGKKLISELALETGIDENTLLEKKETNKLDKLPKLDKIEKYIQQNCLIAQKIIREKEQDKNVGKAKNVYLTGEFLNLPRVLDLARVYFPNQNVEVADPKAGLVIDTEKFMPLDKKRGAESIPYSIYFTNAIGVAKRALGKNGHDFINLLPDRLKESLSNKKAALFIAITSIFITAAALFVATFLFFQFENQQFMRSELEIKKSAIEKTIYGTRYQEIRDQIIAFNDEVNVLSSIDNTLFSMPTTLRNIEILIPEGVELSVLKYNDEDLAFEINGIAENRAKLLEVQNSFKNAEFISEVISPISNYDQRTRISFLMKVKLDFTKLHKYAATTTTR